MAIYSYKAIDNKGKLNTGTLESENYHSLGETLKQKGLFLMEAQIRRVREVFPAAAVRQPPSLAQKARTEISIKRVDLTILAVFTSELAIMIRTGLPLVEAIHTLAKQHTHAGFRDVLSQLFREVQQGKSLSDAFAEFPQIFDSAYLAILRSGEASGNLPVMLERLGKFLRFRREMRSKVQSALLYPAIIMLTAMAVVAFLIIFILPAFADIFSQFNTALPLPTQVLLALGGHFRACWWLYMAVGGGCAGGVHYWLRNPSHVSILERGELRVPFVGELIRNIVLTRVLRTLGALVASGVPILESLSLAGEAASHVAFRDILERVRRAASEGRGLSTALVNDPLFPEAAAHMIANAELTGTLPEVMDEISEYYEQETDTSIRNLFTVVEPLFVAIIGAAVGLVAVSILWPIFRLDSAVL
jgi:type II secretory pathway component PulF